MASTIFLPRFLSCQTLLPYLVLQATPTSVHACCSRWCPRIWLTFTEDWEVAEGKCGSVEASARTCQQVVPDTFLTGHRKYQIPEVSSQGGLLSLSWSSRACRGAALLYFIMPSRSCFFPSSSWSPSYLITRREMPEVILSILVCVIMGELWSHSEPVSIVTAFHIQDYRGDSVNTVT